jgi:hypothetical protein
MNSHLCLLASQETINNYHLGLNEGKFELDSTFSCSNWADRVAGVRYYASITVPSDVTPEKLTDGWYPYYVTSKVVILQWNDIWNHPAFKLINHVSHEHLFTLVPKSTFTRQFCVKYFTDYCHSHHSAKLIPEECLNEKIVMAVIKKDVNQLVWFPQTLYTQNVVRLAVSIDRKAFRMVPQTMYKDFPDLSAQYLSDQAREYRSMCP